MAEQKAEVGAMWVRKGPKGEFWSGMIDVDALHAASVAAGQDPKKVQIVMFKNQYTTTKNGKPAPAFRILHDTWKPGAQPQRREQQEPQPPPPDDLSFPDGEIAF